MFNAYMWLFNVIGLAVDGCVSSPNNFWISASVALDLAATANINSSTCKWGWRRTWSKCSLHQMIIITYHSLNVIFYGWTLLKLWQNFAKLLQLNRCQFLGHILFHLFNLFIGQFLSRHQISRRFLQWTFIQAMLMRVTWRFPTWAIVIAVYNSTRNVVLNEIKCN